MKVAHWVRPLLYRDAAKVIVGHFPNCGMDALVSIIHIIIRIFHKGGIKSTTLETICVLSIIFFCGIQLVRRVYQDFIYLSYN